MSKWQVTGSRDGKPVSAIIEAKDRNEAVKRGSHAPHMMIVKSCNIFETAEEREAARQLCIAAYRALAA